MNIRLKVSLLVAAGIAAATAASALVFASLQLSALEATERAHRRLIADDIGRTISEAQLAKDPLMLLDAIRALERRGEITSARARIDGRWQDVGGPPADPKDVITESAEHGDDAALLDFSRAQAQQRLMKSREELASNTLRTGATVALLGLLVAFPLSWTLTRRIVRIEKALNDIGSGTLDARLPPLGSDEIGRLAAGVNAMAEKLAELEKLKKTFVASVTHELRSPLGVIEGYVKQLLSQSTTLTPQDRSNLERIQNNARRLGHFVTNLLDFAKIERGKLDFSPRMASAAELVEDTVKFFEPKAKEAGITLYAEVEPGIPAVKLDPDLITHVITNLLSNALKFTRPGGKILVSLRRQEGSLEIAVADSGVGIREEDLPRIFAPFQRVANPLKATGVGLGLAISKQIVAMHEGTIGVASEAGKGSRFHLTLPLDGATIS